MGRQDPQLTRRRAKAQMDLPLGPMAPRESVVGAGKVWIKNLSAHMKGAGRAIPEPSTCKNPFGPLFPETDAN
jgi:hypothetical protein